MSTPAIDTIIIGDDRRGQAVSEGVLITHNNVQSLIEATNALLKMAPEGYILYRLQDMTINAQLLDYQLAKDDGTGLWYDGRMMIDAPVPEAVSYISPGSYFNLPAGKMPLWSLSFDALVVRKEVLAAVGFLDPSFSTVEGAMAAWVFRLLFGGVITKDIPLSTDPRKRVPPINIPIEDQLTLASVCFGSRWVTWLKLRWLCRGKLRGLGRKQRGQRSAVRHRMTFPKWRDTPIQGRPKISIIIPTIERYPYLETVIKQLKQQSILPHEVIVIDQTPTNERNPALFVGHEDIGLKYYQMDEAGQCRSRNLGLLNASGDYILFIDDDVEMKPDLLEEHLKCLSYFDADVSCGVCEEAGSGPIPDDFKYIRMSDVLPTNNGMVKRSVLCRSGLFDMAFDHGQRADGDLGARIYKTGARLILNPEISVFHHRAPRGGLRKHKVRKVTFSSSRQFISHFRLPHTTELYLNKVHFTKREQTEYIVLSLAGTFAIKGSHLKKLAKIGYAFVCLPANCYKVWLRNRKANRMLDTFPDIPKMPLEQN